MDPLNNVVDIHKGKPGFVLGAGYSLLDFDLKKILPKGITFACNAASMSIDTCDYFCISDFIVTNEMGGKYYERGKEITKAVAFCNPRHFTEEYEKTVKIKKSYLFNRRYGHIDDYKFDRGDGLLIQGVDIVQVATNLAHVMGCSPIILIGVDLNYREGLNYAFDNEDKSWRDRSNEEGFKYRQSNILKNAAENWKLLKAANPDIDIQIANPHSEIAGLFKVADMSIYG